MASKPKRRPENNSSTIEKRGFTTMKDYKFRYTWKISKYSLCQKKAGEAIASPQFSFMADRELSWVLRLYPNGHSSDANHLSIYLELISIVIGPGIKVVFKWYILSKNGEESNALSDSKGSIYTQKNRTWGFCKYIRKDYLLKEQRDLLLPNDTLTIICDITVFIGIDSQPGAEFHVPPCRMSIDIEQLFLNPTFTDIKLIVGSEQLQAHKGILAARSPVFAAMLETKQVNNEVKIDDVSHEILTEVLRFIYSGKVKNLGVVAKDLITAADKFALERLKVICEEELYANLTVENAAEVLMVADRHNSIQLRKQAIDFIAQHARDVLQTASYKLMLTIPSLIQEVVQAIVSDNSKPHTDSGATDGVSGRTATS